MDHPNIAKVFDAATTETGQAYFVMELVRGISITEYCDQNELPIKERLGLFIKVCQAIQHAHQKGIIHRDIKPSNILVTFHDTVPVPKVIDFGIAKATEGRLTDATVYTQLHQFIGTPAYMSPEQAQMSGLDIDTRSDIYSLGVLPYQLLVGRPPFEAKELMASGIDAMRKTIREKEAMRPSTKLTQELVAAKAVGRVAPRAPSSGEGISTGSGHGVTRPTLKSDEEVRVPSRRLLQIRETITLLRGDLDWIVMKCLEKDRSRRYETANGLAADLKRHLANEPVVARPASTAYKFQKFVHRNRTAVTVAGSILTGLVAVLILLSVSYQRERAARAAEASERQRAAAEALRARQFQYASDMNLAHQAVDDGNLFRALQLLDRHRPTGKVASGRWQVASNETESLPPDPQLITRHSTLNSQPSTDLRGWEWRYLWLQCQGEQRFILGSHSNGVTAVGFLPNGKTAFSAGKDNAVRLWDLETKRQVAVLPHAAKVTGAACSPDGRWLATSTEDRKNPLRLWDLATQQAIQGLLTNASLRPNSLAFSPDSKLLAFLDYRTGVHVWSLAAHRDIAQLPAYHHWLASWGLAFSPDGLSLAYSENEAGDIVLWNIRGRSVVRRLKGHAWYVTALAFTPDGQLLVSGSADRTVKLWDVASGSERATFTNSNLGHGVHDVTSARLSPDGKLLATAASGGGQRITIQDVPSGREIIRFRGHQNFVTDMAFSPDERTFISGSLDGTVRLWDLTPSLSSSSTFSVESITWLPRHFQWGRTSGPPSPPGGNSLDFLRALRP
ncbi:MAG: WD40 repeat domain-containing serine/threonine protein kinase [Limisphaerales bacterium]